MELTIALKERKDRPWYSQIYGQIRDAVLSGRLGTGEKLPSTRELAASLQLSRNTINLAYERLLAEGYLESRRGSGTYASTHIPARLGKSTAAVSGSAEPIRLARWARDLEKWRDAPSSLDLPYDFKPGRPSLDHFPAATWRRITSRHLRRLSPELARYGEPAGYWPLREAIAAYLRRSRAVICNPDQVVVTAGAQQALDLLARLLLSPGQRVVVENPCYPGAVAVFRAARAKLIAVPVDAQGIQIDFLPQGARLLYVTPSHQYPCGGLLPLSRRLALLNWARKHRTVVIEDDYDCEFRYGSRPVESLQGLDQSGLVIYLGTFSKVLFPKLRVGYIVLPASLVKQFVALKWISDRQTVGLDQRFLADFMIEGYFGRYLRRMSRLYRERREALLESLDRHAREYIEVVPSVAGLHLTGWMRGRVNMTLLKARAAELGVGIYPLTPYFLEDPRPGLLFGYGAISTGNIRTGIRRLGQILASLVS